MHTDVRDVAEYLHAVVYPEHTEGPDPRLPRDVVALLARAIRALQQAERALGVEEERWQERGRERLAEAQGALESLDAETLPDATRLAVLAAREVASR